MILITRIYWGYFSIFAKPNIIKKRMIKKIFCSIICLQVIVVQAQEQWEDFTGKERAFFYQLTRKIENINPVGFHLFEFTDSIPYINDTLPDYPYIVKAIEADSSRLILHSSEFGRKQTGIVSDIAMHYATWELDLVLHFRNSEKAKHAHLKDKLLRFEHYVLEQAPQAATKRDANGTYQINPTLTSYYSPNLSISEKIAALKNAKLNDDQKYSMIKAIYYAKEKYLKLRANEIANLLSNGKIESVNYMLAAGDGDNWTEHESVLRTRYNRPLPDPKALFRYELSTERDEKKNTKKTVVEDLPVLKLNTVAGQSTNLHVDVWGYHPERQTTIVVQKAGKSYILYGKNEHRYVSPDDSYETGITYRSLVEELKIMIADLNDRIYGKRGYDYMIEKFEKKAEAMRYKIKDTEIALNKIRHIPAGPPKMKKKKKSKKASSVSYQDSQTPPQGKLTKTAKKKLVLQSDLVDQNGQLQTFLNTIKQLKIEKELAFDLLSQYNNRMDIMSKTIGQNIMTYTVDKSNNYTFSDGTTFNYASQDLTFKPEDESQYFEVILVSFGKHVLDPKQEEVFVHFNLNHNLNKDKYLLYKEENALSQTPHYTVSDSIQIMEFFTALTKTKLKTNVTLNGLGVASGTSPYYSSVPSPTITEEGSENKNQLTYCSLIQTDEKINIELSVFSNAVKPKNIANIPISKYKVASMNDIDNLTLIENQKHFETWKNNMYTLAKIWLKDSPDQKLALKKIKKLKVNSVRYKGREI